jgi:hypothetical protein
MEADACVLLDAENKTGKNGFYNKSNNILRYNNVVWYCMAFRVVLYGILCGIVWHTPF